MADVARLVVGAQQDGAGVHEGAAYAGAHGDDQAAGLAEARPPARLAERVGVHVVHDASLHAEGGLELCAQARPAPAGHDLVRVGDVTSPGVDDARGGDADPVDGGTRLLDHAAHGIDGALEHDRAAALGLRGDLADGIDPRPLAGGERHQGRCDLGAADVERHHALGVCHVLCLLLLVRDPGAAWRPGPSSTGFRLAQ